MPESKRTEKMGKETLNSDRMFLKTISEAVGLLLIKWLKDTQLLTREIQQGQKGITEFLSGHTHRDPFSPDPAHRAVFRMFNDLLEVSV